MPGAKDNQPRSIADKYSLDYYRRPLSTRSWKSPWNWTFLMIALASVAGMYIARGNESFQAAPVSSEHSTFGANCSACHDRSWQTAQRLVTLSDAHHSVSDAACQSCHQAAEHVPGLLAERDCVSCHQEHRPEQSLTQLADNNCTRCHGNLQDHLATASFVSRITQFAAGDGAHPEFALLRGSRSGMGERHKASNVAEFKPETAGASGGKWIDRGGLKFNHRAHLNSAGVMGPDGQRITLQCAGCHLPEGDGAYIADVNYEQHCAKCHPLRLGGDLAGVGEIPHASVEQVRGVIRERLAEQLQPAGGAEAAGESARLPLLSTPAQLTADQKRDLETRLAAADHAVFGLEAKGMCRQCHHVEARDGAWLVKMVNPEFGEALKTEIASDPPMVPRRWLLHGGFHHKAHRAIACEKCHDALDSSETTDILLPSIAVCRDCHGTDVSTAATTVRDDCVLCHTYHDEAAHFPGVDFERLFFGGRPAEPAATPTP